LIVIPVEEFYRASGLDAAVTGESLRQSAKMHVKTVVGRQRDALERYTKGQPVAPQQPAQHQPSSNFEGKMNDLRRRSEAGERFSDDDALDVLDSLFPSRD
jgi:hypothetical protein